MKVVKSIEHAQLSKELKELERLLILHNDNEDVLKLLGFKTLKEFELFILKQTGFKNLQMSAMALGYENEYSLLIKNEQIIDNRISSKDVIKGTFKNAFIQFITDKHTSFLNEREIYLKDSFNDLIKKYNELKIQWNERHIGFTNDGKLTFFPTSFLR
jgi:hypothetical protein